MRGRLRTLGKLEREAGAALQEAWTDEAVRRLGDYDVALLDEALQRGLDPRKPRHEQGVAISPGEWKALETFLKLYQKAQRGA